MNSRQDSNPGPLNLSLCLTYLTDATDHLTTQPEPEFDNSLDWICFKFGPDWDQAGLLLQRYIIRTSICVIKVTFLFELGTSSDTPLCSVLYSECCSITTSQSALIQCCLFPLSRAEI